MNRVQVIRPRNEFLGGQVFDVHERTDELNCPWL
jgi:hypothetical protein